MVEQFRVNDRAVVQLRVRSWEGYRVLYDLVQRLPNKAFTLPAIRDMDRRFREGGVFENVVPDLLLLGVLGPTDKGPRVLTFISRLTAPQDSQSIPCPGRGLRKTVSASVTNRGGITPKKRGITSGSVEKIKDLWKKTKGVDVVAKDHLEDLCVTTLGSACRLLRAAAKSPNAYLFELPGSSTPTFRWIRDPNSGEVLL